ncbi:gamma-glutamyltransferase [Staphylococcus simiae]|uniref:Glutathione hydrolase proenzyme n=1 Tax=Staphylococcus simiae CCM 7213 = CCUG 51256 TaxID=911238 RepID=G5JIE4_9STAP|nr:gamma-glutamyltransferase [Staphylococcus simiae]EHJ08035.1 gamma-glutamyltransferase [Staphylococcus simiae CCM 7213 = CCUG 51256]PNZ14556.1 gamma-glutamyltransferase [Staphylococcus simiae]SNV58019.1 Gamma-glutamyltranspeptidase [Staphylococcus simiae]
MVMSLSGNKENTSQEGMISVSHPLAAKVGKEVLDKGGNAMDAVIAIQLSLNVVEPFTSGLGGGGYLLYYDQATQQMTAFDARETAPSNIDPTFYLDDQGNYKSFFDLTTHGKTVAVPAIPKLFDYLYHHYCRLSLDDLINPAIQQASEGHRANWATEKYSRQQLARLLKYPETAEAFTIDDDYWHEGDWIVQPQLAKALTLLRDQGFDAFYRGDIAQQLVDVVQRYGGSITLEDLQQYQIQLKEPISATYKDVEIHSIGPSSSGGITMIQILKLLEHIDIKKMGPRSVDYLHHLIQAMHIAYSDRAQFIADEDFSNIPIKALIDDDYLKERSTLINKDYANIAITHGHLQSNVSHTAIDEQHTETTHFSVIDKDGNIASFTTSVGMIYGSGITIPGYGLLLNTTIDGFDIVPGGINEIEPCKRPLSNMAPTIITKDSKPILTVGSPGAISIITSIVQTLINVLEFDMTIDQAIDEPRIYSSHPNRIEWEPQFSQRTILALIAKGHAMEKQPDTYIGDVHGLQIDPETSAVMGGADDTREGTIIGEDVYIVRDKPQEYKHYNDNKDYHVYLNDIQLPLYQQQIIFDDDKFWLDSKVVNDIFQVEDYQLDEVRSDVINQREYIDIVDLATQKGYDVIVEDNTLYLRDTYYPTRQREENMYYRYDRESITR